MKKTAVEWMANELLYLDNEYDMKFIDKNEYQIRRKQIIEHAKEMEKEQIMDAYLQGQYDGDTMRDTDAEQYYTETFKSE
jgi:hypothetical protein